jgi:hypothetical protein
VNQNRIAGMAAADGAIQLGRVRCRLLARNVDLGRACLGAEGGDRNDRAGRKRCAALPRTISWSTSQATMSINVAPCIDPPRM